MRLMIVGMGGWGRDWARSMLAKVPAVELVACVDASDQALDTTVAQEIVARERCFRGVEEAAASAAPDAALITSDPASHAALVRRCLEAGLHVLVEKPFALGHDEAAELVALAEERRRSLMVSQNYRFYPAVATVRSLVTEGCLGSLNGVDVEFRQYSPRLPDEPHHHLAEPLLVDMSVHHFDLLRAVLGADAVEVCCRSWNPPWSWFAGPAEGAALIAFADGTSVSYRASWLSQGRLTPWSGRWRMDFEHGELSWTSRGDKRDGIDGESVVLRRPGRAGQAIPIAPLALVDRAGCLAELVAALEAGREPESSGRENLGTVALMEAAVASASARSGDARAETAAGRPEPGRFVSVPSVAARRWRDDELAARRRRDDELAERDGPNGAAR